MEEQIGYGKIVSDQHSKLDASFEKLDASFEKLGAQFEQMIEQLTLLKSSLRSFIKVRFDIDVDFDALSESSPSSVKVVPMDAEAQILFDEKSSPISAAIIDDQHALEASTWCNKEYFQGEDGKLHNYSPEPTPDSTLELKEDFVNDDKTNDRLGNESYLLVRDTPFSLPKAPFAYVTAIISINYGGMRIEESNCVLKPTWMFDGIDNLGILESHVCNLLICPREKGKLYDYKTDVTSLRSGNHGNLILVYSSLDERVIVMFDPGGYLNLGIDYVLNSVLHKKSVLILVGRQSDVEMAVTKFGAKLMSLIVSILFELFEEINGYPLIWWECDLEIMDSISYILGLALLLKETQWIILERLSIVFGIAISGPDLLPFNCLMDENLCCRMGSTRVEFDLVGFVMTLIGEETQVGGQQFSQSLTFVQSSSPVAVSWAYGTGLETYIPLNCTSHPAVVLVAEGSVVDPNILEKFGISSIRKSPVNVENYVEKSFEPRGKIDKAERALVLKLVLCKSSGLVLVRQKSEAEIFRALIDNLKTTVRTMKQCEISLMSVHEGQVSCTSGSQHKEVEVLKLFFMSLASQSQGNTKLATRSIFMVYIEIDGPLLDRFFHLIMKNYSNKNADEASVAPNSTQNCKGTAQGVSYRLAKVQGQFNNFLTEVTRFYHDLMWKFKATNGLSLRYFSDDFEGQIPLSHGEIRFEELKKGRICYNCCLINLGDLVRSEDLYGNGDSMAIDFVKASSCYMLARAIAGGSQDADFSSAGSKFEKMFVGLGVPKVKYLFAAVRKRSPCLIFTNEIEDIGGSHNKSILNSNDQQYMKVTLYRLLLVLDEFKQNEGTIVIASIYFPELLANSWMRPGQFDCHIVVPDPDIERLRQILELHMSQILKADYIDMIIVEGSPRCSYAGLASLGNIIALKVAADGTKTVTMAGLVNAYDIVWWRQGHFTDMLDAILLDFHDHDILGANGFLYTTLCQTYTKLAPTEHCCHILSRLAAIV